MILIDAVFVASHGGINVLKTLLNSIEVNEKKLFILFIDHRLQKLELDTENFKRVLYIKKGILSRQLNFLKIENEINVVLSLGNVPLVVPKKIYQITYNMQYFVFDISMITSLRLKFSWLLKGLIIRTLFKFTKSDVAVQTNTMALLFKNINSGGKIYNFPIFKPIIKGKKIDNTPTNFIYITSDQPYKKVDFLINAFNQHNKKHKESKLFLTIEDENVFDNLNKLCNNNITNLGYVKNDLVNEILSSNYNLVHPSLIESFGIVLLEASWNGNAIIAPDLDYVFDVCKPSLTYTSNSLESLVEALDLASVKPLMSAKPLIHNKSRDLINHLILKNG